MSITTERNQPAHDRENPPHPGLVVLQECIEPLGLTVTDAAAALGVTRNTLSELVNGKRGISPEMVHNGSFVQLEIRTAFAREPSGRASV
jgi:addiction module HigA family antidote